VNDPERWADGHADPVVRSLFAAGAEEEPSPALVARVLAPLGAVAATAAATAGSLAPAAGTGAGGAAGGGAAGTLAASSVPAGLGGSTLLVALKWAGIASIGSAIGVGTVAAVKSRPDEHAGATATAGVVSAASAPIAPSATQATPTAHAEGAFTASAPVDPSAAPSASGAAEGARPSATMGNPARPVASAEERRLRLGDEALLIDDARRSITRGDAGAALRTLDTHRRLHPRPLLAPEALYLEMRAHELRGHHDAAQKLATRLLAAYPNGVHAARARALLEARDP
jgi:hypothetical protein